MSRKSYVLRSKNLATALITKSDVH